MHRSTVASMVHATALSRSTKALTRPATAVALCLALAAALFAAPEARAQSAIPGVDPARAVTSSAPARETAPPPADTSRAQILRVQPQGGRKVLADVWSPSMGRAIPTFLLLPPRPGPAPLLLLLNGVGGGEDHVGWAYHTDYQNFFANKQVLVASPEGGRFSLYTDWQRPDPILGVNMWRTFLDAELPAALAAQYQLNDRRGVIGVSMSAGPALALAATSGNRYAAAASLSGSPVTSTPLAQLSMAAMVARGGGNIGNAWGPPNDPAWAFNDPSRNVERLRGTAIYLASASGIPGSNDGAEIGLGTYIGGAATEVASDLGTRQMADALRAGGIPFTYDRYDNGAHTFSLFNRELRDSWRVVGPALGA